MKYLGLFITVLAFVSTIVGYNYARFRFHKLNRACVEYENTKWKFADFARGDKIMQQAILEDCTAETANKMFGTLP